MTDERPFSTQLRELERAIKTGDRRRTGRVLLELAQSERPPSKVLEEFIDEVVAGNHEEAEAVLTHLQRTYEERSIAEAADFERAVVARSRSELSRDGRDHLAAQIESSVVVELERSSFLLDATGFLTNPDQWDERTVLESADQLLKDEQEYEQAREESAPVVEAIDIPANVTILEVEIATIAVDTTESVMVTVGNIGDEPAHGIAVSMSVDGQLDIAPELATVDQLAPDDKTKLSFEVTGEETGSYRITVEIDSENAGSATKTTSFDVVERSQERSNAILDRLPEWVVPLGGASALGAAGYAALEYLSSKNIVEDAE